MDERFPLTEIPPEVSNIAAKLRAAGHEAWYVGGAVRDKLLSLRTTHHAPRTFVGDFDIATSARPEEVVALFKRTVPVGIEHGTVAVLDRENRGHEVTTFRRDVKTDGRHAEVAFGVSLDDDLARRDFTINAIAVHTESGEIRDPFEGRRDLEAGLLRAVGDAATRFREDRLRVLRGLRFAAVFGFALEPGTFGALRASAGELAHLSRERVRDEWLKMLRGAPAARAIALYRTAGVLHEVWPELAALSDDAIAEMDELAPGDAVLVTAAALVRAGASPDAARQAATRLRFSNQDIARVAGVAAALSGGVPEAGNGPALRRWMSRHHGVEGDASLVAPGDPEARSNLIRAVMDQHLAGAPLTVGDLAVKGDDLKAAGIPAGPEMGRILKSLLEAVLDDPGLNTREALLARAKPS